jgi:uncharacterized protein with PIN domain
MKTAWLRLYAELNDFLPPRTRHRPLAHTFAARTSVKDAIEAQGVPHTEIDLILVNGQSVDFSYLLDDGDRVSVYPVFEAFDVLPLTRLRREPLRVVRFVLDGHLGRLAAYLRLAGFDTAYQTDCGDDDLARTSAETHRILLTRDLALLKRGNVTHGYWVRATDPRQQLVEVLRRFDLARLVKPFTRCVRCNGQLRPATLAAVADRVPPRIRDTFVEFAVCPDCHRVYWKGSHHARMTTFLTEAIESARR